MLERLLDLIETVDDPKLQKEIAQDWLDRSGHVSKKQQTERTFALVLTADTLLEFQKRRTESDLTSEARGQHSKVIEGELV